MKARSGNHVWAAALAGLVVVVGCLGAIRHSEKKRGIRQQQLDDAVQAWEAEGGALPVTDDEEEVRSTAG